MKNQVLNHLLDVRRPRSTTTKLVTAYNKIAHLWDSKIRRLGYDRAHTDLFRRLGATLLPQPPGVEVPVLDCGIGTGALSLALVRATGAKVRVHGIDICPKMIFNWCCWMSLACTGVKA